MQIQHELYSYLDSTEAECLQYIVTLLTKILTALQRN
jgi:hypothetical protein